MYIFAKLTNGIPVHNAVANITIHNGQVVNMASRLEKNIAQRANSSSPSITPQQAINAAALGFKAGTPSNLQELEVKGTNSFIYSKGGISQEDIPVKLMYQLGPEGELFLVWDLSIYLLDGDHWWSARIDAMNSSLRGKIDWVRSCDFPDHPRKAHSHRTNTLVNPNPAMPQITGLPGQYRVFPYTIESPNHGPRILAFEPADSIASPYGWHDTDGVSGAEYTITRGNNVYAQEDQDGDNNTTGYSPDGGPSLNFDFPLNLNQIASAYEDASITNLFYMNNIMHDLWYQYGFDEESGNFQTNNYGNGGIGGDL